MKFYFLIGIVLVMLSSCEESRLNRENSRLVTRNYTEWSPDDCGDTLGYGQVYIEFFNIDREKMLSKLKHLNDSVFGQQRDTMLYYTSGTPWSESNQWLTNELFVHIHDNHYGYVIFPHQIDLESKIIQHGVGNLSSQHGEYEDMKFSYQFSICTKEKLASKYTKYGIKVEKALLTETAADSIYPQGSTDNFPATYTNNIQYSVEEFVADITIMLRLKEGGDEQEYYAITMEDTIRYYSFP